MCSRCKLHIEWGHTSCTDQQCCNFRQGKESLRLEYNMFCIKSRTETALVLLTREPVQNRSQTLSIYG